MSASDKADAKIEEMKGRAKEAAGDAVGNERMRAEGRTDQAEGHGRQAAQHLKDAAKGLLKRDGD